MDNHYVLYVQYNKPIVKSFFGIYTNTETIVDVLKTFKDLNHIPTASEIRATFVATDAYIIEEDLITVTIGEVSPRMVEYACGKIQRIRPELLYPAGFDLKI